MKKYLLFLLLLISACMLLAEKVGNLREIMKPGYIQVDGDDLFVAERAGNSIYIFSLKTQELKSKVGKKGEGPGEFKSWPFILEITPDHFLTYAMDRLAWFSRDGKLIKEKTVANVRAATPIKENYLCWMQIPDLRTSEGIRFIFLVNSNFEKIKDLLKVKVDVFFSRTLEGVTKFDMLRNYIGYLIYDDKIFIANTRKGFFIDVLDANGNPLYAIDKNSEIEKIKVTDTFKERRMNAYKVAYRDRYARIKKSAFVFFEYFPAIRSFWIDQGKIYVTTYKEQDNKTELIILDIKGNILKKIFLPFKSQKDYKHFGEYDPHTIHKGILYELIENEETETWELHKTDLSTIK